MVHLCTICDQRFYKYKCLRKHWDVCKAPPQQLRHITIDPSQNSWLNDCEFLNLAHEHTHIGESEPYTHEHTHTGENEPYTHEHTHTGENEPYTYEHTHTGENESYTHEHTHTGEKNHIHMKIPTQVRTNHIHMSILTQVRTYLMSVVNCYLLYSVLLKPLPYNFYNQTITQSHLPHPNMYGTLSPAALI